MDRVSAINSAPAMGRITQDRDPRSIKGPASEGRARVKAEASSLGMLGDAIDRK